MINSFTVRNFRGFRETTIDACERVNLIAGMNNVGKTSLLEAIFLHVNPNNVRVLINIGIQRENVLNRLKVSEVFKWVFLDKN